MTEDVQSVLSTFASNSWRALWLDFRCFLFWNSLCLQTRKVTIIHFWDVTEKHAMSKEASLSLTQHLYFARSAGRYIDLNFQAPKGKETQESYQERLSVQFGGEKPVYYLPAIPNMDIMYGIFIIWCWKSIKLVYDGPLLNTCLQHHNLKILCTMSCTKPCPKIFTYTKTFILQSFEK